MWLILHPPSGYLSKASLALVSLRVSLRFSFPSPVLHKRSTAASSIRLRQVRVTHDHLEGPLAKQLGHGAQVDAGRDEPAREGVARSCQWKSSIPGSSSALSHQCLGFLNRLPCSPIKTRPCPRGSVLGLAQGYPGAGTNVVPGELVLLSQSDTAVKRDLKLRHMFGAITLDHGQGPSSSSSERKRSRSLSSLRCFTKPGSEVHILLPAARRKTGDSS
jgi:hypothetical protein